MKELEVSILDLKSDLEAHKTRINANVHKFEERNTVEHDHIMDKIDIILEKVTELRIYQASNEKSRIKREKE